jgi:hypothetical protein
VLVERCIAVGTIKIPGKDVALPQGAGSLDAAASHLAAYQDALATRIEEPRAYFIRPATRVHLVKALAGFPHGTHAPYAAPTFKKAATDPADDERPASLALQPMQMEAAKDAAQRTAAGNFTEFVIDAMAAKADQLGMRSPRATMPTFTHYPAQQLLPLQRNIEEPALALIVAHQQLVARLAGARGAAAHVERVRASCDRLLQHMLVIEVEAASE